MRQRETDSGISLGDLPEHLTRYRQACLTKRERKRPREPARIKLFERSNAELARICDRISEAFGAFDLEEVRPVDIAHFVDQWEGRRAAQIYRARLSDFFAWAIRRGLRHDNPAREVTVDTPPRRARYITHGEYHAIRDALLIGADGRPTRSGPMVQAYVDLCYLLYQRTTEIRLLKTSDVRGDAILFTPTKTEHSSGAKVAVPISPAVRMVLDGLRSSSKLQSIYLIHTLAGQPYTPNGIRAAWIRACHRAGVVNATLKDLRAKAATDAQSAGFSKEQIRIGLAHTDGATTDGYLRSRETPRSEVVMRLPPR